MHVILLHDVPKLGKKYSVVSVSDGHAANYLIPRKLAQYATKTAIAKAEKEQAQQKDTKRIQHDLLLKNVADLKGLTVTIMGKANEQGHLFAGIDAEQISTAIKAETHLDIPVEAIDLKKPLKELGEHTVRVAQEGAEATCTILVKQVG